MLIVYFSFFAASSQLTEALLFKISQRDILRQVLGGFFIIIIVIKIIFESESIKPMLVKFLIQGATRNEAKLDLLGVIVY